MQSDRFYKNFNIRLGLYLLYSQKLQSNHEKNLPNNAIVFDILRICPK